jgi:hypothetical protein
MIDCSLPSKAKIEDAIQKMMNKRAAGWDGIYIYIFVTFIKHLIPK